MPWDVVKNFAKVNVSQGYDNTATTIQLALGEGDKLPDPATEGQYNLVWWNATDYSDPTDDPFKEIVRVTAKSGDQITILRGQEDTVAQNHNLAGKSYRMMLTLTKKTYDDLQTIEVYKDGTFVGQRARLNFQNFADISDDVANKRINLNLPNFKQDDRFGDGSDGDFTASTGTTVFDLQNKLLFVKNFNDFSLTGNAQISFTNPHDNGTMVIFKVKGTATITSTATPAINASEIGAKGGTPTVNGSNGFNLYFSYALESKGGGAGPNNLFTYGTSASGIESFPKNLVQFPLLKTFVVCVGGGGGGGGMSTGSTITPGSGGRGGGIFILFADSLNFSSSIYANGNNGTNASGGTGNNQASGGGGGGGGGSIVILAKVISSLSGTLQAKGGNGGNSAILSGPNTALAGGGAGGGSASDSAQAGISFVLPGFTPTVSVDAGVNGNDITGTQMAKGGQGGAGGYVLVSTTI